MNWVYWIVICVLVIAVLQSKKEPPKQQKQIETGEEITETPQTDFSQNYQKKYLLTKNEYYECKKLMQYASEKELIVCPKVRLLDIIEPRKGQENYMSYLQKVQSKHVDFVICDKALHILGVIELDDNSHDQKNRKERDVFVNQILQSVGYTVVHTRGIDENTLGAFIETRAET